MKKLIKLIKRVKNPPTNHSVDELNLGNLQVKELEFVAAWSQGRTQPRNCTRAARPAPPPPPAATQPAAARRHRQHRHDHFASRRRPQYPLPRQPRLLEVPVCAASAGSLRSVASRYCMAIQSGEDGWRHHREEEVDDSAIVTYDPCPGLM